MATAVGIVFGTFPMPPEPLVPNIEIVQAKTQEVIKPKTDLEIQKIAALKYGISVFDLIYLDEKETPDNTRLIGDIDIPRKGYASYGRYQINTFYHPEVTIEQAMNFQFATDWVAKAISEGHIGWWSVIRNPNK